VAHAALARGAGIGLRAPHHGEILARRPALAFVEVHSENFFAAGGPLPATLERVRALYPLSLHGVGLSLGSVDPLDEAHLARLEALVRRFEPALVSEHLSWSSVDARHANELLPLPHTIEAAAHVASRIARVQDRLGRRILVENVSSYLTFRHSTMTEWEFLAALAEQADCGLLLDVNNVFVSARNHGFDPIAFIDGVPRDRVGQFHLAGHSDKGTHLLDTHDHPVRDEVWELYRHAVRRFGAQATLLERDDDIPPLDELVAEARRAADVAAEAA
jgi:uncharacterized protein (UPF0276 family)